MDTLEWIAAALGLLNVGLLVRRSVWNYPFGIAMVSLYFFVFRDAKLYSDMGLQVFFLVIQLYGWWNWLRARTGDGAVRVGVLTPRRRLLWGVGAVAVGVAWGIGMAQLTDAAAPVPDALIASMSVAAQLLLALRCVENWVLWIAVDLLAVGLYASRGLYATAALYAVFLVMAAAGLVEWRRALAGRAAA